MNKASFLENGVRAESAVRDLTQRAESITEARTGIVSLALGEIWALMDNDSVACSEFSDGRANGFDGPGAVASRYDRRCDWAIYTLRN